MSNTDNAQTRIIKAIQNDILHYNCTSPNHTLAIRVKYFPIKRYVDIFIDGRKISENLDLKEAHFMIMGMMLEASRNHRDRLLMELSNNSLAKDGSLCDSCIHSRICRFEVPVGETCEHYIKG